MRVTLHLTRSGEYLLDLPFTGVSWSTGVCVADDVTVTIPGYIEEKFTQYMSPRKFSVAISDDDGRVLAAGALNIPEGETDRDGIDALSFPFAGPESIYERRYVLPYPYWPLVDAGDFPITARDTVLTDMDFGTMMKRLLVQAMSHPGGEIPVIWEADRVGTRSSSWDAVGNHGVQASIEKLAEQDGGPEWDWVPMLDQDERLVWAFVTGTEAVPELSSAYRPTWQSGGEDPSIRKLKLKVTPEFMNQTAIVSGGKENESVMIARSTGTDLIDAGFPLMEEWETDGASESNQGTLNRLATRKRANGKRPTQYLSFEVRVDRAGALRHGDWCQVDVFDHWLVPDGSYDLRIVEISGDAEGEYLGVTAAGEATW